MSAKPAPTQDRRVGAGLGGNIQSHWHKYHRRNLPDVDDQNSSEEPDYDA